MLIAKNKISALSKSNITLAILYLLLKNSLKVIWQEYYEFK